MRRASPGIGQPSTSRRPSLGGVAPINMRSVVVLPAPFGRRGESFELVKNVRPNEGYDYVMLRGGLSGSVALEEIAPNCTRLRFREAFHIAKAPLSWFEGPIYRFINKKNEESMRGAAGW